MHVIRKEEKGYTYNIFSALDPMHFDGYFYVGTEVGNEFVEPTLESIYGEFDKLKKEPIKKEELKMLWLKLLLQLFFCVFYQIL
mgnify:CR=1 FL=1